jgi:CHAD domain-containing protein
MPGSDDTPLSAKEQRARAREYRLHEGEPADAGVRRVAKGRVETALQHLRRDAGKDLATAVHDTRKDMKKLRSVLRLVRDELGDKRYRAENERYRDAARLLASSRDAEVKLETLSALRERYGDEVPPAKRLTRALTTEREREAGSADGAELGARLEQAARAIEAGGEAIDDWPLDVSGWKLLRSGLERGYRRGRRRFADVRADPTPEAVHEWRKRVKDLWYHLRLLREIWPQALEAQSDLAHELSDLLGDHHDLTVLADEIRARGDRDPPVLLALCERRQQELLDRALPLGERLYAEQPKQFAARLEAYWRAAHRA